MSMPMDDVYRALGFEPPVLRVDVDDAGVSHVVEVEPAVPYPWGGSLDAVGDCSGSLGAALKAKADEQVRHALVVELQRQARVYPGFSADRTSDPNLLAVHGILTVDELLSAVMAVLVPERPASGPWASWGGDGVGP